MDAQDSRAQAFRSAVESADAAQIRRLFQEHPSLAEVVEEKWFSFETPAFVYAAKIGNREMLDALLDVGADPDARSGWEAGPYTALTSLLDGGGPEAIALAEHLAGRGATIDLHAAAGMARLDILAEILDAQPERVSEPGPDGATPLHLAANPEVAAFLLERGAEIDKRCVDHNSTAAMWAITKRPEVTRFLVERGTRPDLFMAAALGDLELARKVLDNEPEAIHVRLRPGRSVEHLGGGDKYVWALGFADTPLEVAHRRGHDAVYAFLLEGSPPALRLVQASRRGDREALQALLDEHPTLLGELAEDDAANLLDAPAVSLRVLLDHGADPNVRDDDVGCTPLHNAAWKGDLDRVRALLEAGADPHLRDRTHASTPLGWAHFNGKTKVAARLLDHEAPDLVDAAWLGLVDRVREILDDDPLEVDGADPASASPLRAAAHTGQTEVVRLLLERGADPTVAGGETGKTALDLARDQGHTDIVVMLETALP